MLLKFVGLFFADAGTHIANGVIVAAGAVVTRSIPQENVIVGGVPAKVIGERPPAPELNMKNQETMEKILEQISPR